MEINDRLDRNKIPVQERVLLSRRDYGLEDSECILELTDSVAQLRNFLVERLRICQYKSSTNELLVAINGGDAHLPGPLSRCKAPC